MKKLPSFKSSGFTLIELMVVISIIAILSVIGVSVYGNVQKTARDGIRRADIAILRNSIEGGRDITAGTYSYDSTKYAADFPQNKPKDPLKSTTAPYYCFATSSGQLLLCLLFQRLGLQLIIVQLMQHQQIIQLG